MYFMACNKFLDPLAIQWCNLSVIIASLLIFFQYGNKKDLSMTSISYQNLIHRCIQLKQSDSSESDCSNKITYISHSIRFKNKSKPRIKSKTQQTSPVSETLFCWVAKRVNHYIVKHQLQAATSPVKKTPDFVPNKVHTKHINYKLLFDLIKPEQNLLIRYLQAIRLQIS